MRWWRRRVCASARRVRSPCSRPQARRSWCNLHPPPHLLLLLLLLLLLRTRLLPLLLRLDRWQQRLLLPPLRLRLSLLSNPHSPHHHQPLCFPHRFVSVWPAFSRSELSLCFVLRVRCSVRCVRVRWSRALCASVCCVRVARARVRRARPSSKTATSSCVTSAPARNPTRERCPFTLSPIHMFELAFVPFNFDCPIVVESLVHVHQLVSAAACIS